MTKRNSDGSSSYFVTGWESQKRLEEDGFSFVDSTELSGLAEASKKLKRDLGNSKDFRILDIVSPSRGSYKGKQFTVVGFDGSDPDVPLFQIESSSLGKSFNIPFYMLKYLGSRKRLEVTPKEFRHTFENGDYEDIRLGAVEDYE